MESFNNIPEYQVSVYHMSMLFPYLMFLHDDQQKSEFMRHLEDQQMKDSLKMYNYLVETCFDKCVAVGWGGVSLSSLIANITFIFVVYLE